MGRGALADPDGDGKVSEAEFVGSAEATLKRADDDGEGNVTMRKLRAERPAR